MKRTIKTMEACELEVELLDNLESAQRRCAETANYIREGRWLEAAENNRCVRRSLKRLTRKLSDEYQSDRFEAMAENARRQMESVPK